MNDLTTLTGRPRRVIVAGRPFLFWPLRYIELGWLQVFLDGYEKDPFAGLDLKSLRDGLGRGAFDYVEFRMAEKPDRFRPLLGSEGADDILGTVEGITETIRLSVNRNRGRRKPINASWLVANIGVEDSADLADWASWGPPGLFQNDTVDADDDDGDDGEKPKARFDMPDEPDADLSRNDSRMDWWKTFNILTNDPIWMPFDKVIRLTIPQAACVRMKKAPHNGINLTIRDYVAKEAQAKRTWNEEW